MIAVLTVGEVLLAESVTLTAGEVLLFSATTKFSGELLAVRVWLPVTDETVVPEGAVQPETE